MECKILQMKYIKKIFFILKISIALFSIIMLSYIVNVEKIISVIENVNLIYFLLIIPIYLIAQIISAQRFVYVSKTLGFNVSLVKSIKVHFIGMWFSNLMPTSLGGDAIKAGLFKNQMGWLNAVSASILDRIFGLIFLLLTIILFAPLYFIYIDKRISTFFFFSSIIIVCVIILLSYLTRFLSIQKFPIILQWIFKIFNDLNLFCKFNKLIQQFWVSGIVHINGIIAYYLIGMSLGFDLEFIIYILIVPLIFLTALLPISFAGWGIRELSAVTLFGIVGIDAELALASSIMFGLLLIVIGIPGLYFLISKKNVNSTQ